jgi:Holliday junction DNA helicase RuvA
LLGAHGVGPALALAIMAVHAPADLRRAVAADDADALCLVPGVGKKTAARLLIDLKTRLDVPEIDLTAVNGSGRVHAAGPRALADVRDALLGLGYSSDEVREAVRDLEDGDDSSALLREALRRLASARSHA